VTWIETVKRGIGEMHRNYFYRIDRIILDIGISSIGGLDFGSAAML
jgi:hypothetical protein